MASENIRSAVASFITHIGPNSGILGYGVGEYADMECIIVYINSTVPVLGFPTEWQGFPVITREIGSIIAGTEQRKR